MRHKTTLAALVVLASVGSVLAQRSVIPMCPKPADAEKLVGFQIKLVVPKDTVFKKVRDIDYEAWGIPFGAPTNRIELTGYSGLNVGNGEVTRFYLDGSRKFSRRYWRHNKQGGIDGRGTLKNGRFWRYFGMFGETLSYYNVPAHAASYFDRILDSACFLN